MIKFDVLNRFTGAVNFTAEIECDETATRSVKLGLAVRWAIMSRANLRSAYLSGADLRGADLRGADLSRAYLSSAYLSSAYLSRADLSRADLRGAYLSSADLSGAYLSGADLSRANLRGADLSRADLRGADLSGAYLSSADLSRANLGGADLSGAYLSGADLSRANLRGAYLSRANLRSADLSGAYLSGADLSRANLGGAVGADLAIARTRILPEGEIIGWKKCQGNVIVKLRIPADAARSHAFGRKCRAAFADVLEVFGADKGISLHDGKTEYVAGQRVTADSFDVDWQQECSGGIHFYVTRPEADAHN